MPAELAAESIDLASIVRPGDTVIWSQGPSEPLSLTRALVEQRAKIGRFRAFLGSSFARTFDPAQADFIEFVGLGAVGHTRKILEAGALQVVPCHLSQFAAMMREREFKIDVVMLQLRQGGSGIHSYGSMCSYLPDAVRNARVVVAEINDAAPYTVSSATVAADRIDYAVKVSRPPIDVPSRPPTAGDVAVAMNVAPLIENGAVLQIGIGTLPDAILSQLQGHRDLGIHSGTIGDGAIALIESGVINNVSKAVNRGISITGGLFGTQALCNFAHRNELMRVEPVSYTHDLRVLASIKGFTTINSAIEIDLFGQINSEVANGKYVGTIGGQTDFVRGTQLADKGRSIVAMSARVSSDGPSRIVAQLSSGIVTAARSDTDFVVTEFGVAALKGQTVAERARRLIAVADPEDREPLERAWAQCAKQTQR
jgi:acetyl-CoA hydrolase